MGMTLEDFLELAIDDYYPCWIWDVDKEEEVFNGEVTDIPDEYRDSTLVSWELDGNKIGLNIEE